MPITELLTRNATYFKNDVALVEINPEVKNVPHVTWREYNLIEAARGGAFRKQLTWGEFDIQANRFANLLLTRGIRKGDKVAILLMNCLEWLPIYFGILKAGAVAVPLNFRYTAEEIKYCLEKSDSDFLVFGPEFIGRVEEIHDRVPRIKDFFYVGDECPSFADSYEKMISYCSSQSPSIYITDEDDGAIYFSSGTTGFPKAILHAHRSLTHSAKVEQAHHHQTKDDVFLCIPPLYHTGAKMHWFGSLRSGSKAVLLRGVSPEWIIRCVSEERCTIVWLLVPWAQDILDAIDSGKIDLNNFELSQWRLMHIGAQPVPPTLIKRWKAIFPHHDYDTNYGLSESIGPGCVHLGIENVSKVGAIGIPGYKWEVKIVDERRNEVTDGVGELAVKGPGVMKCYYKDEEATYHHGRREPLSRPDRGLPARPQRHQGRGGHRTARPASRRNRRGDHRGQGGLHAHRAGGQRLLHGAAALQETAQGDLCQGAAQPDGQDREARSQKNLLRRKRCRPAE